MNCSFADHAPGMSFKGALDYYLHDRKEPGETEHRTSSERVEWSSKQGEQDRSAANTQLEQRVDAQAKAQSRAAQATQNARQQCVKEKAAAKDRGAAEKRSLQDKSLARSKAKDALAGLRSQRPSLKNGKTQDRER